VILHLLEHLFDAQQSHLARAMLSQGAKLARRDLIALDGVGLGVEGVHVIDERAGNVGRQVYWRAGLGRRLMRSPLDGRASSKVPIVSAVCYRVTPANRGPAHGGLLRRRRIFVATGNNVQIFVGQLNPGHVAAIDHLACSHGHSRDCCKVIPVRSEPW
jgi:hypothetical protein